MSTVHALRGLAAPRALRWLFMCTSALCAMVLSFGFKTPLSLPYSHPGRRSFPFRNIPITVTLSLVELRHMNASTSLLVKRVFYGVYSNVALCAEFTMVLPFGFVTPLSLHYSRPGRRSFPFCDVLITIPLSLAKLRHLSASTPFLVKRHRKH